MKHCNSCDTTKPRSDFHKRAASIDGLCAKCKPCQAKYDKSRANLPHRVAAREEYQRTRSGLDAMNRSRRRWVKRNKEKRVAHYAVSNAVRDGRLDKQDACTKCGSKKRIEAHHEDYSKPLDVEWLCLKCHRAKHGQKAA